jgi:hypothetical protein
MPTITLKYTKTMDYFICNLLPYLEQYFLEYPTITIIFYSVEYICTIVSVMFSENIITKKIQKNIDLINSNIIELDEYLSYFYDLNDALQLTKPLSISDSPMKIRNFVCIFPKYQLKNPCDNINKETLTSLFDTVNKNKYEMYIIGDQFERLNMKLGKDIDNLIDTLSALKYCKLFITSYSIWYYIALLCNCRNIILYDSTHRERNYNFNSFKSNVYRTVDISSHEILQKINEILSTKN